MPGKACKRSVPGSQGRPSVWRTIFRGRGHQRVAAVLVLVMAAVLLTGCWNRTNARAYAAEYYQSKNSDYFNWDFPGSGDCTDFASQALHKGGIGFTTLPGPPAESTTNVWFGIKENNITTETALYYLAELTAASKNRWEGITARFSPTGPGILTTGESGYHDSLNWMREKTFVHWLLDHNNAQGTPRATLEGSYSYQTSDKGPAPSTPPGMHTGDIYAYNLQSNNKSLTATDHVEIQVAGGPTAPVTAYTTPHYSGDLVSSDDAPLYGAFWSLKVQQTETTGSFKTMTIYFIHLSTTD